MHRSCTRPARRQTRCRIVTSCVTHHPIICPRLRRAAAPYPTPTLTPGTAPARRSEVVFICETHSFEHARRNAERKRAIVSSSSSDSPPPQCRPASQRMSASRYDCFFRSAAFACAVCYRECAHRYPHAEVYPRRGGEHFAAEVDPLRESMVDLVLLLLPLVAPVNVLYVQNIHVNEDEQVTQFMQQMTQRQQ